MLAVGMHFPTLPRSATSQPRAQFPPYEVFPLLDSGLVPTGAVREFPTNRGSISPTVSRL